MNFSKWLNEMALPKFGLGVKDAYDMPAISTKKEAESLAEELRQHLELPPGKKAYLDPQNAGKIKPDTFEIRVSGGPHVITGAEQWYLDLILFESAPIEIEGMYRFTDSTGKKQPVIVKFEKRRRRR